MTGSACPQSAHCPDGCIFQATRLALPSGGPLAQDKEPRTRSEVNFVSVALWRSRHVRVLQIDRHTPLASRRPTACRSAILMVMDKWRRAVRQHQCARGGRCRGAQLSGAQLSVGRVETYRTASTVTWTNCHFGDRRPWFICSVRTNGQHCGRCVAVLYLGGDSVACRKCCGLAYESQQGGLQFRNLRKAQSIRLRLGGSPDPFTPFPAKPRCMQSGPIGVTPQGRSPRLPQPGFPPRFAHPTDPRRNAGRLPTLGPCGRSP
jgi:hypothetical protein